VNGNLGIFEGLQDTDVYQAACEASTESDAQFGAARLWHFHGRLWIRRAGELAGKRAHGTSEAT
jgi:hypothetical protein